MNKVLIYVYILITGLFICVTEVSAEEKIENSWLITDKNLLSSADYLFKAEIKSIKDINGFSSFIYDKKDDRNIGLNYRLVHLKKYGGYSTLNLVILANKKDEIVMYKIEIDSKKIVWGLLLKEFGYTSIASANIDKQGLNLIIKNEIPHKKLKDEFEEYFGTPHNIAIPVKIKLEYELLTEPVNEIVYGAMCGGAGLKPFGREALDKIMKYGNIKIIENILVSANPEGRIYAVEALFSKNIESLKSKNSYSSTVDNIIKFNVPVLCCAFCGSEYYDISKIYNLYSLIRSNLSLN